MNLLNLFSHRQLFDICTGISKYGSSDVIRRAKRYYIERKYLFSILLCFLSNEFKFDSFAEDCAGKIDSQKSRKRTRNPSQHKSSQKKAKVQKGKEYVTKSMKRVPEKTFAEQTRCKCKRNCAQYIDVNCQRHFFESFYALSNWNQKTLFLRTLAKKLLCEPTMNPINNLKKKEFYHKYYLTNMAGNQVEVCLWFLITCLQITKSKMLRAISNTVSNEIAKDFRGAYPTKKTEVDDYDYLKTFIEKYPKYESHYKISASTKKYLSPYMNIEILYRQYTISCESEERTILSALCSVMFSTRNLI